MKLAIRCFSMKTAAIIDDLMATRRGDAFYLVVNGATKHGDLEVFEHGFRAAPWSTI